MAEKPRTPALEWLLGGIGLLLVAGTMAFLAWSGIVQGDRPPDVRVEVEEIQRQNNGWRVAVLARNEGGEAAAEVLIRGRLADPRGTVEESELRLDFLPASSERRGGLFFTRDPAGFDLTVRPVGYAEP
ncbi:hypothetical protein IGS68_21965 [Skermanella sp. TT6]|uniref:TIGR02588 family protein n=1 Tax=Skermanella cutis TaxID=2775420 RepID=A0ABX7B2W1_9PROT|nr:hypothetical protein [Skermanella sp. TT6]QQP88659.1 hypothetical protein IGS68_21965 [Skermanella sp. TT6]